MCANCLQLAWFACHVKVIYCWAFGCLFCHCWMAARLIFETGSFVIWAVIGLCGFSQSLNSNFDLWLSVVCLKLLIWAKVIINETNVKIFLRKLKLSYWKLSEWLIMNKFLKAIVTFNILSTDFCTWCGTWRMFIPSLKKAHSLKDHVHVEM